MSEPYFHGRTLMSRLAYLFVFASLLSGCSLFGGFDMESAPPAFPADAVQQLGETPEFDRDPMRTLRAQAFTVYHFGDGEDVDSFAFVSQPADELVAWGTYGDVEEESYSELYDFLLDECRQVSMKNQGPEGVKLDTVRCGKEFVAGLEKLNDGSIAITFLENLDQHQAVSRHLGEMNRRGRGVTGSNLKVSISMDWSAEQSVPLQPGAAKIPAPDDRVWFGIDYMVENTGEVEQSFRPSNTVAVDVQGQRWEAAADETARSNGGLEEVVLPPGQKARVRTLIPVTKEVAEQGFRVHFRGLGEDGWYIGYRTTDHTEAEAESEEPTRGALQPEPQGTLPSEESDAGEGEDGTPSSDNSDVTEPETGHAGDEE
jgi:hypothetical protein